MAGGPGQYESDEAATGDTADPAFDYACPHCGSSLQQYVETCPCCGVNLDEQFSATFRVPASAAARKIALATLIALALLVLAALVGQWLGGASRLPPA